MDLGRIAIRAIFAYLFLLALIRSSGKKTIAQGTVFDFVIALVLGDLIDDFLWAEVPAGQFVVAAGIIVLAHLLVEIGSSKSELFSTLVGGSPLMFLRAGSLLRPALRREQMNEKEAAEMLRLKGLGPERTVEIKSAWLETSGRPAVLRRDWSKSAQRKDLAALRKLKQ